MFVIKKHRLAPKVRIQAAVFDFDGTLSTFRTGWEQVMRIMMLEFICDGKQPDMEILHEVDFYIEQSTGQQTIHQMQWLVNAIEQHQGKTIAHDAWWYKHEYTRRLKETIKDRITAVATGQAFPSEYLISGATAFLHDLSGAGVQLFLVSGTDHPDVVYEASLLKIDKLFADIKGAPVDRAAFSKEAVIQMFVDELGIRGRELLVVGDGPVEIELGANYGAVVLGVASDESKRRGVSEVKKTRLINAGAQAIVGDYEQSGLIFQWLQVEM
ncbi:HAD family hydrolase [Alicyclobacillaceae bacterium I2511]|nr:HAD family hydrolase [Alicyclobacillaceae bacterium I2511]